MSGDADLCESFVRGEDVHRRTASEIFRVPVDRVDDRMRGIAKAINFGLMYGKTPFGLAQELSISRREASEMIEAYFIRYSGVKKFLDQQILDARERGWTVTLFGRRRYLRDISSKNHAVRANAERMAMNAPIQGTAADLMKIAMIAIDERLKVSRFHERPLKSQMIIQVHDEVLLDVVPEELQFVRGLVVESMEHAVKWRVPLVVNAESGKDWMAV
jgi:DNA polymerase-1